MDAFAVAVSVGLTMLKTDIKKALIVGLYFGAFQAGMPVIGYFFAIQFSEQVMVWDNWIVFVLLTFLGGKMIVDAVKNKRCTDRECQKLPSFNTSKPSKMIPLALATSVDALAVGISFAFLQVNVGIAVSFIGITTFTLSVLGVKIGVVFGAKLKSKAVIAGGIILILMGINVLVG